LTPYSDDEKADAQSRLAVEADAAARVTLHDKIATLLAADPSAARNTALIEAVARLALKATRS
jgi:hypothetical protein